MHCGYEGFFISIWGNKMNSLTSLLHVHFSRYLLELYSPPVARGSIWGCWTLSQQTELYRLLDLQICVWNAAGRQAGRADVSPMPGLKEMMDIWIMGVMWDAKGAVASSLLGLLDVGQTYCRPCAKEELHPPDRLPYDLTAASGLMRTDLLHFKLRS